MKQKLKCPTLEGRLNNPLTSELDAIEQINAS